MRLVPALTWMMEGGSDAALDARLVPLLEAIAATGSLAAAVAERQMSYRSAWGLFRGAERYFGAAVGLTLELTFMGSLHALQQFAEGRADAAGFHVALGTRNVAPFRHWLNVRRDRLIRFVDREQGLILPRGNPSRIRKFKDIAKK